ncbi:TetR/AcrR family transcriptional regulator [Curtobacterium sp. ME12]|uniref:TetR/AcrR family transcriptional regulator n=1 Tax=Curtobacterium sp. ME12 TaxID=2744253 RepID=UPI001C70E09F|nr:TetR/AcrR family transcriptional regulator [Curtobacterium sp. ME12]
MILDTAEQLFAEQGVRTVSNRQISEAAGQGNNTAVGYHFGSKTDLVAAIVRRHHEDIERRRDQMVTSLPTAPTVEDWVACLVRPTAEHLEALRRADGVSYYARLSAQLLADPELRNVIVGEAGEGTSVREVTTQLIQNDSSMPGQVRRERATISRQLITWGYAEREKSLAAGEDELGWSAYATILTDSLTAVWLAPWAGDECGS